MSAQGREDAALGAAWRRAEASAAGPVSLRGTFTLKGTAREYIATAYTQWGAMEGEAGAAKPATALEALVEGLEAHRTAEL